MMGHLHAMRAAHHQADLVHRQALRWPGLGQPAAVQRRKTVGNFQQLIQILADHHYCRPLCRPVDQRLPDGGRRRSIHPPGRLIHHDDCRGLAQFPSHDEFLQVAARQGACRHPDARGPYVIAFHDLFGKGARCGPVDEAARHQALADGTRQQGVFRQAHVGGRRMAQPFLGCCHQSGPAAFVRALVAAALPVDPDDVPARAQLARQRQQQLVLPIARHPGNAQNLALLHGKADVFQRSAERIGRAHR